MPTGMSNAAANLLASRSIRLPPVSRAASACSGGIASQVRIWNSFVGQVEMPTPRKFMACNQHGVQLGQAAGRAGNARFRVHHEHQNLELPFHHLGQTRRGHFAEFELFGEPLAGPYDILGQGVASQSERPTQKRARASDLLGQMAVCPDPLSRLALIRFQPLHVDIVLPPGEAPFADKEEGIGEIVERGAQLFDREHQLVGRHTSDARLDGGDGLPVLETEYQGKIVLRELLRLSQCPNSLPICVCITSPPMPYYLAFMYMQDNPRKINCKKPFQKGQSPAASRVVVGRASPVRLLHGEGREAAPNNSRPGPGGNPTPLATVRAFRMIPSCRKVYVYNILILLYKIRKGALQEAPPAV